MLAKSHQCPFCDKGIAHHAVGMKTYNYKGNDITITEHFYKCELCHEEFTTTESDELTLTELENRYESINKK